MSIPLTTSGPTTAPRASFTLNAAGLNMIRDKFNVQPSLSDAKRKKELDYIIKRFRQAVSEKNYKKVRGLLENYDKEIQAGVSKEEFEQATAKI